MYSDKNSVINVSSELILEMKETARVFDETEKESLQFFAVLSEFLLILICSVSRKGERKNEIYRERKREGPSVEEKSLLPFDKTRTKVFSSVYCS